MTACTLHPTALRPWQPLSDEEWEAMRPYLPADGGRGRPCNRRKTLNAVFWIAASREPWAALPDHLGRGESVAKTLRRWARAGLLDRMLVAISDQPLASTDPALRRLAWLICRAFRRMARILPEDSLRLAERLGLRAAWPVAVFRWPDLRCIAVVREIAQARAAEVAAAPRNRGVIQAAMRLYGLCAKVSRYALGNRRDWRLK